MSRLYGRRPGRVSQRIRQRQRQTLLRRRARRAQRPPVLILPIRFWLASNKRKKASKA